MNTGLYYDTIDCMKLIKKKYPWIPRYFAGVDETGQPLAWVNGRTSFTVSPINDIGNNCSTWRYMKLYKED